MHLVGFIIRIYHDALHLNLKSLKLSCCVWSQHFKILCNTGLTLFHHIWSQKLLSVFQKMAWKSFIMLPRETGNRLSYSGWSSKFGWTVIYIVTRQRIGIPENTFWMWRHITNRNVLTENSFWMWRHITNRNVLTENTFWMWCHITKRNLLTCSKNLLPSPIG